MEKLLEKKDYLNQDVSYEVVKLSNDKIKIVVKWHQTPSKGHKIQIQDVEVQGDEIEVIYKKIYPNGDSINCQVISNSYDSWEGTVDTSPDTYTIVLTHKAH